MERLRGELKEAWNEIKAQKAELDTLRAQAPPVPTMAQYQTMPPGQPYGLPMQTGTMPQGHYSPTVVPYALAANLTASPGQVSTLAGFSYQGTPAQGPQVHGSPQPQGPQPQGPQVFLRPPTFVPPGTPQAPPQQVQGSYSILGWPDRVKDSNEPVVGPGTASRPGNTPLSPLSELD